MIIIVPYTHYEFKPPSRITQSDFESLKSIDRVELTQLLTATGERERHAFIKAHPVQHVLTIFTFFILVASTVGGLLLIGIYATGLGDQIVSATVEAVLFAFCGSFFSAAFVVRSYAETYSSFRTFLATRQRFYLKLKRQIDSTPTFDVFVYNLRTNLPLVRLFRWLRNLAKLCAPMTSQGWRKKRG